MKATEMTFKECADWLVAYRPDIRFTQKYNNATDLLIELTMSCDAVECLCTMKKAMENCQRTRNGYGFLAAYDLYTHIKEEL